LLRSLPRRVPSPRRHALWQPPIFGGSAGTVIAIVTVVGLNITGAAARLRVRPAAASVMFPPVSGSCYVTAGPGWARSRRAPSADSTGRAAAVTGLSASSSGSSPARGGTPASIASAAPQSAAVS
jgi:hypothetical protein